MIINAEEYMDTFRCNQILANYLIYNKKVPLLSVKKNYYYFRKNELLDKALKSLPFYIKIISKLL